jgi:hypothetical protein
MARRFLSILLFFAAMISLAVQPAAAASPLPPLPPQAVRDYVLSQTNGAQFTPLGIPLNINLGLLNFNGILDGVENLVDYSQAVHYITTTGRLTETVIPLRNSGSQLMLPDLLTLDGLPGKIIGVLYQPSRGVMVIVGTYNSMPTGSGAAQPNSLRFYLSNNQFTTVAYNWGTFSDINNDQVLESVDEGVVIADGYTCIAVGLNQMCWTPSNYSTLRDSAPKTLVTNAVNHLHGVYDFDTDFYVQDAVPDMLGRSLRLQCAANLLNILNLSLLNVCKPSAVFSASTTVVSGQPIAVMVVRSASNVRTYDSAGSYVGNLPAGDYLVMDAMPQITQPGAATLLYLVNADGVHHYLIPSVVQQGYGQNGAIQSRWAGIRDGLMAWRGVGY